MTPIHNHTQGDTMNHASILTGTPIGKSVPFLGGFFAGVIRIAEQNFALIVAPKDQGEHPDCRWGKDKKVDGAQSYCDGLANTNAMSASGSDLAKWARGLTISGFDDWYLPAQDELEIIYRNLKPTTETNSLYMHSGLNVSAVPPTYPYTSDLPAQTSADAFKEGGEQAFDDVIYWSSTQHAATSDFAWYQYFTLGTQRGHHKSAELRARAVRRLSI